MISSTVPMIPMVLSGMMTAASELVRQIMPAIERSVPYSRDTNACPIEANTRIIVPSILLAIQLPESAVGWAMRMMINTISSMI